MTNPSDMDSSYSRSIKINASSNAIFHALTKDLQGWWGRMDRPVSKTGDVFTVSWGEPWYRFQVSNFEAPTSLRWKCIDANQIIHGLEGVQKEWVGTELDWKIEEISPAVSRVTFTHMGLVPEFKCYDFCSAAWDRFFGEGLKTYLEDKNN